MIPDDYAEQLEELRMLTKARNVDGLTAYLWSPVESGVVPIRAAAALRLGRLKDGRAVEPLVRLLGDASETARAAAAIALGDLRDQSATDPLVDALHDPSQRVANAAIVSLGKLGDARAVSPLINKLNSSDWRVRKLTIGALGKIGDANAIGALEDLLRRERRVDQKWGIRRSLRRLRRTKRHPA